MSGTRGAWFSVNEDEALATWVFASVVVSSHTLDAGALAFSLDEVLQHARAWIEA